MNPHSAWPDSRRRLSASRSLLVVGLGLFGLIIADADVLPWIEGSAEPALLSVGPWSRLPFAPAVPISLGTSLTIFLAIAILAGLTGLYAIALNQARNPPARAFPIVLVVTALLCAGVVLAPPVRNGDIFYYAFQGRMIARGGLNPYVEPPRNRVDDEWFPFVSPIWRNLTTGYGPVWLLISAGIDRGFDGGGAIPDFVSTILAYRVLFAILTMANVVLLWVILGILAPARRLIGAIAFAWNPAVIRVGVEHNDTVMLALALVGIWLHLRRRPLLAVVALTLSALIKYYTLPLLVAYLVWQWHMYPPGERIKRVSLPTASVALAALCILPFDPVAILTHFPTYLVESKRLAHLAEVPFELLLGLGIGVGFLVVRISKARTFEQILGVGLLALFAYLAFLSRDWFPWYLVTAIGLSALLGGLWLDVAASAGGSWLLALHGGTSWLVGLGMSTLALPPGKTLQLIVFVPSFLIGMALLLWRKRDWPMRSLLVVGLVTLAGFTAAVEAPLVGWWPDHAPVFDLSGAPASGPEIFGSTLEWDDWSWGVSVGQVGTPGGPNGPRSLCLTFSDPNGAFYVHHSGFSTHDYAAIQLDVDPLAGNPRALSLVVRGDRGQTLTPVSLASYFDAAPTFDGWKRLGVPLTALGASNTKITGVLIQSGGAIGAGATCFQRIVFAAGA